MIDCNFMIGFTVIKCTLIFNSHLYLDVNSLFQSQTLLLNMDSKRRYMNGMCSNIQDMIMIGCSAC